jgi:hypothetical protein
MSEYYTYIYYDPLRNNEPIYVGKGTKDRAWSHLTRKDEHAFTERLAVLEYRQAKPIIGIYGGLTEDEAYSLEERLVTEIGRINIGTGSLLNKIPGGRCKFFEEPYLTEEELKEIEDYRKSLASKRKSPRVYKEKIPKVCKKVTPKKISEKKPIKWKRRHRDYSKEATCIAIRKILCKPYS